MPDQRARSGGTGPGQRRRWRGAGAPFGPPRCRCGGVCGPAAPAVLAQRSEPRVTVPATLAAEAASQAALQIQVGPPDALPSNTFVRLRGLPHSISLTEGHAIGPGSWAVPLFSLPTLKAIIPAGVSGRSELSVSLVAVDGTILRRCAPHWWSSDDGLPKQAGAKCAAPKPCSDRPHRIATRAELVRRRQGPRREADRTGGPLPGAGQHRARAAVLPARRRRRLALLAPSGWPPPTIPASLPACRCRAWSPTARKRASGTSAPGNSERRRPRSGWPALGGS